jgi:hypothetical protein
MNTPDLLWKSVAAEYDSWSGGMVGGQSLPTDCAAASGGSPLWNVDAKPSVPRLQVIGSPAIRAFAPILRSLYAAGHAACALTKAAVRT